MEEKNERVNGRWTGYKFYRVPEDCTDMNEVLVRYCIDRHRDLDDYSAVSVRQIVNECGYKTDYSNHGFAGDVRNALKNIVDSGHATLVYEDTKLDGVNKNWHVLLKLSSEFAPASHYITFPSELFDFLASKNWEMGKPLMLQVYLYVRSYIYKDSKSSHAYGFFKSVDSMAKDLGISRGRCDKCLEALVKGNILKTKYVGKYVDEDGKCKNAPNIYVLPDEYADKNIEDLTKALKNKIGVQNFTSADYKKKGRKTTGTPDIAEKKLKEIETETATETTETTAVDRKEQNSEEQDNYWGQPNVMQTCRKNPFVD